MCNLVVELLPQGQGFPFNRHYHKILKYRALGDASED